MKSKAGGTANTGAHAKSDAKDSMIKVAISKEP